MTRAELEEAMAHVLQENYGGIVTLQRHRTTAKRLLTLLDADEARHKVKVTGNDFTIEHPLIERLTGTLFDCDMNDTVKWWPSQLEDGYWWLRLDKRANYGVFFEKVE